MDFSYSEEQQAIIDLAKQILSDGCTADRLKAVEKPGGVRFDKAVWEQLATAGLLGIPVAAEYGGAGLGFFELAAILEQIGRTAAPLPVFETLVLGALPIQQFGSAAQRETLLPRVVTGDVVITAALAEPQGDPAQPAMTATKDGKAWKLNGTKICVPAGQLAERIIVPATTGKKKVGVFVVDSRSNGVTIVPLDTSSGHPEALVTLTDVIVGPGDVLGKAGDGACIIEWMTERATAGLCALALGVCQEAVRLTAEYTQNRKQFDQPIAMFQAVGHRAADAYIDTEAIRLSAWQAAWRIGAGMPAAAAVAVAKFWAAEGGQRVVHAAQHLHGGAGVDREYPLHRYFLFAKQLELTLGGATAQLLTLGRMLANTPA